MFIWDFFTDVFNRVNDALGSAFWQTLWTLTIVVLIYIASRFLRTRLREFGRDRFGLDNNFPSLIDNILRVVLFVVMGIIVFSALGVDSTALVAYFGLATAAITLSLQDVLRNIFCGLYLLAEQPFRAGDRIRVMAEEGWVERIDLRVTRIRNDRHELIMIPNQTLFNQVVGNRSTRQSRPFTFQIAGIPLTIDEAEQKTRDVFNGMPDLNSDPVIRLLKSGPEGVELEITCRRTSSEKQQERIARELVAAFPEATLSVLAR